MKKWICLSMLGITAAAYAGSVPGQITYQGTLKESGIPVNGSRTMLFRLTNANGTAVYWSGGNQTVNVVQGLFSAVLTPSGVDWENIAPYIEVSVNGQVLLPREAVTSTAYALTCESVANETGMIAMFASSCPHGWTRFSALDGLFPMGGAAYGATGGSATHFHTLTVSSVLYTAGGVNVVGVQPGSAGLGAFSGGGSASVNATNNYTDSKSSLPPYLTLVFCQKQ